MPSSSYIAGRFYPAILPGVDIVSQAGLASYRLYAVPFSLAAAITPASLSLGISGGAPGNGITSGVTLPGGIRAPGVVVSIYNSNASGRPSGAPLVTTALAQLANATWPLAMPTQQLPAGLLWAVVEFFGDASSQLPNLLSTGGASGAAVMVGSSAPGRAEPRQPGGLVLPATNDPSSPTLTLTGTEVWQDAPAGTGCPVVWIGL